MTIKKTELFLFFTTRILLCKLSQLNLLSSKYQQKDFKQLYNKFIKLIYELRIFLSKNLETFLYVSNKTYQLPTKTVYTRFSKIRGQF